MKTTASILTLIILISCSVRPYPSAFISDRDGHYDIYIHMPTDSSLLRITDSREIKYNLVWGEAGKAIYYTLYKTKGREILSYNLKTGSTNTILNDSTILSLADLSSDNNKLLFSSSEHNKKGELYLYDLETKNRTRITNNEFVESGAKFSPKNNNLIAASIQTAKIDTINHGGNAEIFLINSLDSTLSPLTNLKGFNALPSFSPNGQYIAFHHCNNGQCDIYVIKKDGSKLKNLTNNQDDNKWPRWTPDGKWIGFTKTINGNSEIYLITPNGKHLKPFITSKYKDEIAEFKPVKNKNNR